MSFFFLNDAYVEAGIRGGSEGLIVERQEGMGLRALNTGDDTVVDKLLTCQVRHHRTPFVIFLVTVCHKFMYYTRVIQCDSNF